ncbi:MAG: PIN domain-containing protein [Saprospiraceae bacterium]
MAKIYLDSCLIISLIEGDATQRQLLKRQLPKHTIYSSELARLETRLLAIRTQNQDSLQKFDSFFAACKIVALGRTVFEQATLLRANSSLKTPDAIHLAAAIYAGCHEFWTDDKPLRAITIQSLKVIDWSALEKME